MNEIQVEVTKATVKVTPVVKEMRVSMKVSTTMKMTLTVKAMKVAMKVATTVKAMKVSTTVKVMKVATTVKVMKVATTVKVMKVATTVKAMKVSISTTVKVIKVSVSTTVKVMKVSMTLKVSTIVAVVMIQTRMMIHWILILIWKFQLFLIQMMIPRMVLNSSKAYKILIYSSNYRIYSESFLVPRIFLRLTRDLPVVCPVGGDTLSTEETITESIERTTIDPNSFIFIYCNIY